MGKPSTLAPEQQRALAKLSRAPGIGQLYLAGGTAVAAHLGHRVSVDLDLFSRDAQVDLDPIGQALLAQFDSGEVVAQTDATLVIRAGDLAIDVVRYPYPPLDEPAPGPQGFPTAGLRDLATMKLSAIARRGIRRDFWDLHEIATKTAVSLKRALDAYPKRFGVQEADLYHVIRSLTYFGDADDEPVYPRGLTQAHWEEIKRYFRSAASSVI